MKFSEKSLHEKLLLNDNWKKKYQNSGFGSVSVADVESGTDNASDETLETLWTSTSCAVTTSSTQTQTQARAETPQEDIVVASTRGVLCLAVVLTSMLALIVLLGLNLL